MVVTSSVVQKLTGGSPDERFARGHAGSATVTSRRWPVITRPLIMFGQRGASFISGANTAAQRMAPLHFASFTAPLRTPLNAEIAAVSSPPPDRHPRKRLKILATLKGDERGLRPPDHILRHHFCSLLPDEVLSNHIRGCMGGWLELC